MKRILMAAGLIAAASCLTTAPAVAQSQRAVDMNLSTAGFIMREANTPAQMARLRSLPPRVMVPHRKNGTRYYVYADPDYCKCAFVGSETAYRQFRTMQPLPQPDNVSAGGGANVVSEMENEMNHDAGIDDLFAPGF